MKMAPGFFWGVVLIFVGLAIIFRVVFNVNLFRIILAVLIILFGIRILVGKNWIQERSKRAHDTIFSDRNYHEIPADKTEYNVFFGKSVYDFSGPDSVLHDTIEIKINVVFGAAVIKINPDMPVRIRSEAVFGGSRMPDGNTVAFGSIYYCTRSYSENSPHLFIDSDVVFGGIEIVDK
jgi:predicted membrane protein